MKRFLWITLLVAVALTAACSSSDQPRDDRPQVLIIGDSISLGYTPFVSDLLKDRAHVVHSPGNAKHTWNGVVWLDKWLGSTQWDVIQAVSLSMPNITMKSPLRSWPSTVFVSTISTG